MTRQELMTNITHRYDWLFDKARLSVTLALVFSSLNRTTTARTFVRCRL